MIEIRNLSKVYPRTRRSEEIVALDNVSLSVPKGSVYGVIGQSGAGKSTLIRCVNGLEHPSAGDVKVNGRSIVRSSSRDLREVRRGIGMIFQGFNLLSSRNVHGNVSLPLEVMGMPRSQRHQRVAEMLQLVGLENRVSSWPSELSGGQKQRVGIARALASYPAVLLSDESTSALDPQTTSSILNLMKRLNVELGLTILLITHEMDVVKRICDHTALIENGRIVESGPTRDLILNPDSRIAQQVFPHSAFISSDQNSLNIIVPIDGQQKLSDLILALEHQFSVRAEVANGSIERIGNENLGQFTLNLGGDDISAAIEWLTQNHGGLVVQR